MVTPLITGLKTLSLLHKVFTLCIIISIDTPILTLLATSVKNCLGLLLGELGEANINFVLKSVPVWLVELGE